MRALMDVTLPGFRPVDDDTQDTWTNDHGDVLGVQFFGLVPDLPAGLDDGPALRAGLAHHMARSGAGLIEASVKPLGGLPALRQIVKVPLPGRQHGQGFVGSFTVPRATCSTAVTFMSAERGTTGMREAMVMAKVGHEQYFRPHPYAPDVQGGLPFHVADHQGYDAEFPDHPLSKVRRTLDVLAARVRVAPGFAALPPFEGPHPG
ncbi:hypothetical protein [Streptomyces sp. NPDC048442]|uniref:hypothetical protein n=1 Tax=Streptomyces sp. NPDC048442 TaxID=3154823 RepID=UPI003428BA75